MKETQYVVSVIDFPIGSDLGAVNVAIAALLREGWEFGNIDKPENTPYHYIRLRREWKFGPSPLIMPLPPK